MGKAALVAAVGLTGCSADPSGPTDPGTRTAPGPSPRPTTSGPDGPARVRPRPYRPHPAEVDGAAKLAAARAVEALPEVERVVYTQYFGYLPPEASILVEADHAAGGGTTYDVRLRQTGRGRWRVTSVEPAAMVRRLTDPGPLARAVLRHDRIDLPWAGRRDVAAGLVADPVLESMLTVAEEHRIGISVLLAAHPVLVFGTDRRSNHADGRAYDIGTVDGRLVVDPRAAERVRSLMRAAAATGAYQVGGPVDLDDGESQYFADLTHSDHVHVGFGSE